MSKSTKDLLTRAMHTFWQTYLAVFFLGLTDVVGAFQKDVGAGKAALAALIVGAAAAGLSAAKTALWSVK